MKKYIVLFLSISFILNACAAQANPSPMPAEIATSTQTSVSVPTSTSEPIHLKLGYQPFLSASAIFIAEDGGYFSQQGLDVELVRFNAGSDVLTAMISGSIDIDTENLSAGAISLVAKGSGYKFVGERGFIDPQSSCSYQDIMVRTDLLKNGFLDNPANVKGLKFATTSASVFEYGLDLQMSKLGLKASDIQLVNMPAQPDRLAALKNGAIDGVTFSEPWVTTTKKSGAGDTWVSYEGLTPNLPLSVVLYGPRLIGNPDIGKRFMVAYLNAIRQYQQGKTDANVAILSKYTGISPDDIKASCWVSIAADGRTHLDTWLPYEQWLVSKGYLDAVVPTNQLWDSEFVDYANSVVK